MPELPEVETTVNELKKRVVGFKIIGVWLGAPKLLKNYSFNDFKKNIKNAKIKDIFRKGKNIIFELDKNRAFLIHQKMTGHLLYGKWEKKDNSWVTIKKGPLSDPMNRFIHLVFYLNNGYMIALSDLRKFAKIIFNSKEKILNLPEIKELGPDALKVSFENFKKQIQKKKNLPIKKVLMDQKVISGIGNIYSDEILFASKINPFRMAKDLSEKDFQNIFKNSKIILKKAISLKGESISDYRAPDGSKGNFDKIRRVYRRGGKKCKRCGGTIERKKIGQRSAHFCPKCQKL